MMDVLNHTNGDHIFEISEELQTLRRKEVLCDIGLRADDDTIVFGHKIILMSASQYFKAMFTNFSEHKKNIVDIKEVDSTVLKQLIDYIYTGKIRISKENVQVLLSAANLLQLDNVKGACAKFLQKQLDPLNCFGIRSFAELHYCLDLVSSCEEYIRRKFLNVVEGEEFLSLSAEELIKFISGDVLNAPEEKVYECVINWVNHELNVRYDSLPKLMEHVRLPLVSLEYISTYVVKDPLFTNIPESKDYLIEAFQFHTLKTQELTIPPTIRNTSRKSGQKVILVFYSSSLTHWYDPTTNLWQHLPEISMMKSKNSVDKLNLVREHIVVAFKSSSVRILDLSLKKPKWKTVVATIVFRRNFGFCVLGDCLYAVGGENNSMHLSSAEVFDINSDKWRMIANMHTKRSEFNIGVLNNLIYAVGGFYDDDGNDGSNAKYLRSVECYDPSLDTWTLIPEMISCRSDASLCEMDGILYAVGGKYEDVRLKTVEAYNPISRVWTPVADMHKARSGSDVFAIDGLLYVVGGLGGYSEYNFRHKILSSWIEAYDPNNNTWSKVSTMESLNAIIGSVIVDKTLVTKFHN